MDIKDDIRGMIKGSLERSFEEQDNHFARFTNNTLQY
jgi:hypothetical protein